MGPLELSEKINNTLDVIPKEHRSNFSIDNYGNVIFKNRAYRRKKPPTDNWVTKNTHSIQKKRKNAKTKHNRRSS